MRRKITAFLAAFLLLGAGVPARAADINDLFRGAMKQYEMGDYEKALKGFVKVMRLDPNNSIAREYMLRCSQRIVETKLGGQASETADREAAVEKQIKEMDGAPAVASPSEVLGDAPEGTSVPAASLPSSTPSSLSDMPAEPSAAGSATAVLDQDALIQDAASALPRNAQDIIAERNALTDDLRRRYLGKGSIVDVEEKGGRLAVTFYMNRLFFPLTDTLRPDAYSVLEDIRGMITADPKRTVTFTSVDNVSPAVRHTMADLSARRTNVVFSTLLYAAFAPSEEGDVAAAQ
jgi:hypothetical protein